MHRTPNYSSPPILLSASHSHLNYPHTDSVVLQKGTSMNETTPRHDRRSMHSSSLFFTAPSHSSSLTPKTPLNPYHPHKYNQQPIPLSFSPASPDPQKNDPMDDGDGDQSNPSSLSLSTPSHTIRDSSSYLSYSLHNSGTNMFTINLSDDISVICFQMAVEGRGGIGAGPLFAVREFDTKFIRSFAFNDNSQSHAMILSESADSMLDDPSSSNRKVFRSLPSEQAMRAAIRQAILNLRLRSEPANKKEIKMLKEANILGKRAPSCSLLNGEDMMRLLRAFGRSDSAKMLRDALRRNIHLFPSGSINESLLDYVCEKEDIPQMNLTDINALGDDEGDGGDEGGGKTEMIEPTTVHHQRRGSLPVYILKGRGKHTRLTDNSDSDEDDPRAVKSADKQDRRRSSKSSASAHKRRRNSSFTRSLSSPMLTAALNSLREQALSDNTEHPSNASASSDDDGLGALLFALEASAPSATTTPPENHTPKVATIVHRGDRDRDRAVQAVIVAKQTQSPPTINASHPSSLPAHPNSSHLVVAVAVATPVNNNGGTPPKSSVAVAVARPASANVTVALEAIPHARPVANNASNPSVNAAAAVAIATPVSANNSRGSVTATVATAVAVPALATPAVAAIAAAVPASRSSQKERRNTHNRAASPVTARPVTIPTPHQQQPTPTVPFKSISAPTTPVHSRPNSPHSAMLHENKRNDPPLNGGNADSDALDTSALRVVVNEIPSRSMAVTKHEEESDSSSRSTTPVSPLTFLSPARDNTTVDAAHTLTSVAAVASESAMVIDSVDEKPRVGFLPPLHPSNYHLNNPLSKSVSTLTNLAFRRSSLSALPSSSSSSSPPLPLASLSISAPSRPSLPLPSSLTSLARHACSTADASRNIQNSVAFDGG